MSDSKTREIAKLLGFESVENNEVISLVDQSEDFQQIEKNIEFMYGDGKNPKLYQISKEILEEKKKSMN